MATNDTESDGRGLSPDRAERTFRGLALRLLALVAALAGAWILLGASPAGAFTVANELDVPIEVEVADGSDVGFRQTVAPGDGEGCHWSNDGCNPGDARDHILVATITSTAACRGSTATTTPSRPSTSNLPA